MRIGRTYRKLVKRYHQRGDLHELTFSCYQKLPLLTSERWCRLLCRELDTAGRKVDVELVAFVIMPDHVHLLVYPLRPEGEIDKYLSRVKQPFSSKVKHILQETGSPLLDKLTVRERPEKTVFRFWQEGSGYDRNLNEVRAIEASIEYLHANPVRRGLCERAVEWPWSSARFYLLDPPCQQFPELPYIHGLPKGALD